MSCSDPFCRPPQPVGVPDSPVTAALTALRVVNRADSQPSVQSKG
jgi:hypothetical protein